MKHSYCYHHKADHFPITACPEEFYSFPPECYTVLALKTPSKNAAYMELCSHPLLAVTQIFVAPFFLLLHV